MALCQTCWTDDARATKTECMTCYMWRRTHDGETRPEDAVMTSNHRRLVRELERKRRLS